MLPRKLLPFRKSRRFSNDEALDESNVFNESCFPLSARPSVEAKQFEEVIDDISPKRLECFALTRWHGRKFGLANYQ